MNKRLSIWFAEASLLFSAAAPNERGATATEYSILAGFVALAIVAGVGLFGTALNSLFGPLTTGVKTALGIP